MRFETNRVFISCMIDACILRRNVKNVLYICSPVRHCVYDLSTTA